MRLDNPYGHFKSSSTIYPYVGYPMVHNNKHVPHKGVRKEFCLGGPPSLLESVFLSKKRNHFGSTYYVCTGQQQRDLRCLQRNAKMNAMYQMNAMYKGGANGI